jgi:preprotein translocase subunit SecG
MDKPSLVLGIIALVIGIGLRYWINRRKFYRRGVAGLEGFSSYEKSVFVRFLERIGKWVAYLLIIIGLLCLWTSTRVEKDEKKLQQQQEITGQVIQR